MCGICGVIGQTTKDWGGTAVRRMLDAIVHRGPDEEALFLSPPVMAGMRRLSIIDLPGGSQPIWNESRTLAILFNGEIYNFRELRAQLESAGHVFRTHSDTEVIVHAYEQWGEGCLIRLHGMFAFALIEMPGGPEAPPTKVFLARDRLGIKPLYYAAMQGAFFFASEVRALLASGRIPRRIAPNSLSAYLLFGSVGEPETMVESVMSLPPGHSLAIEANSPVPVPQPKPFWSLAVASKTGASPASTDLQAPGNPSETPAQRVRKLLEDSVRHHLIADVPVGVFLSSGVDSTALAALASRAQPGVHTFTVAFPDAKFSEGEIARRTAHTLGTEHREMYLSGDDMSSQLGAAVAALDQPTVDGINTYIVSWAAHQAGLKVALSGLGSDEIFGGYSTFRTTASVDRLSGLGRILPAPLRSLAAGIFTRLWQRPASPDASRKAFSALRDPHALPHAYFFSRALFTPRAAASGLRQDLYSWRGLPWYGWLARAAGEAESLDAFSAVSWLELRSYMTNMLLRDVDAMSMHHSLEVRVPFLDAPFIDYVVSLPQQAKRISAKPKALLIEALGDLLPAEIAAQKKRTFDFPWDNWLRGPLGPRVIAGFDDWSPSLEPHLGREFPRKVWDDFCARRTSWSRPWSLYILNEWVKRHLDSESASGGQNEIAAAKTVA